MKLRFACVLVCAAQPLVVMAAVDPPPKAQACMACHGPDGISVAADIPNLAGQKKDYLLRQLKAFREGTRKNDLMSAIAKQLDADDLLQLTAYWSSLPATGAGGAAATAAPHAATVSKMALPADFQAGFSEYSRAEDKAQKTVGVRYANGAALAAAKAGQPLPEGSAIVVVNHLAQLDVAGNPVADAAGRWQLGAIKSYSGMETRPGWGDNIPEILRNGNWNYGLWSAQRAPAIAALQPRCLACHKPKAGESYVFTLGEMRHAQ